MLRFSTLLKVCLCAASLLWLPYSLEAGMPKLIVVVSYDQLRGDRLEFFKEDLGRKGFARVRAEGVAFDSCVYKHAVNLTAPGHSVLLTGTDPYQHGIVGNDYFDRKEGKMVHATEDTGGVRSPRNLLAPTIGQLLKTASPKSKVFGMAIKDRAAILMTGLKANCALWLQPERGGLGTSKHYQSPAWLQEFNLAHNLRTFGGQTWNASQAAVKLPSPAEMEAHLKSHPGGKPPADLPHLTASQIISLNDNMPWEGDFPGGGSKVFPHVIPAYGSDDFWEAFISTPYSIDWIMDAAKLCIQKEQLGKGDHSDMICIGVSTTDEVGHRFGPNSREMKEILISADRSLAGFIDFLDSELGREKYELIICSDHGVAEIPENGSQTGGRIAGRLSRKNVADAMQNPYQNFLPVAVDGADVAAQEPKGFIKQFSPPFIFLDSSVVKGIASTFPAICDTLCGLLRGVQGIGIAIPTHRILANQRPESIDPETFELIRHSVYAPRSGDIVIFPQERWLFGSKPTTHGTPYHYDRWVPLMFFGNGLSPKVVTSPSHPEDLAPTLAEQLELKLPKTDGQPLPLR